MFHHVLLLVLLQPALHHLSPVLARLLVRSVRDAVRLVASPIVEDLPRRLLDEFLLVPVALLIVDIEQMQRSCIFNTSGVLLVKRTLGNAAHY